MTDDKSIATARRVISIEAGAVAALSSRLNGSFSTAVEMMFAATGKVVVTGMGKSGIICQKIASTLSSTGTPAFFLHPAEGTHGDLGMVMRNDVLVAVSNSGETEELIKIIPVVKRLGLKMIAMTGRPGSTLARAADVALDVGVKEEACPLGLAPTASTTATLAMGDALAVALLERRDFKPEDFALLHPAGSLGRRLRRVEELMHAGAELPRVSRGTSMRNAILVMTAKRLGLTGVFDGDRLVGVVTDGDLRRALERGDDLLSKSVDEVMTRGPKVIPATEVAEAALKKMEEATITSLFVCDAAGVVVGIIHMHDLVRAGVL
ncbi:MAG: KpsF/GutQ family sugar-phosphate isomerase [Deltaproteobacteria bacterium]|nr:KpsF/GutQ family sugar-phosphate isomerase [Deltaproteobacteria bacterium]